MVVVSRGGWELIVRRLWATRSLKRLLKIRRGRRRPHQGEHSTFGDLVRIDVEARVMIEVLFLFVVGFGVRSRCAGSHQVEVVDGGVEFRVVLLAEIYEDIMLPRDFRLGLA